MPTLLNAYALTISLAGINGLGAPNVQVSVSLVDQELIYPVGMPSETLLPNLLHVITNGLGVVTFELLPSALVGKYKVDIGGYEKKFEMPANDVRFSELPEVSS